jgi:membrane-associated phospholipid phosphatase
VKRRSTPAILAALLLVAVMAVTAAFPEVDLGVARRFYEAEGGSFSARFDTTLMGLREIGFYLPVALLALACLGWLYGRWNARAAKLFTGRRLMFLALSFALGPGLIVNVVLKNASHRPRPAQVDTFGGVNPFRPWYAFDGGCATNCSFVSGEVAGAAWLAAPASLAPPIWRGVALTGAALFTVAVAALRLAFGGHFLSDAAGAALVALSCILAVGLALRRKGESWL